MTKIGNINIPDKNYKLTFNFKEPNIKIITDITAIADGEYDDYEKTINNVELNLPSEMCVYDNYKYNVINELVFTGTKNSLKINTNGISNGYKISAAIKTVLQNKYTSYDDDEVYGAFIQTFFEKEIEYSSEIKPETGFKRLWEYLLNETYEDNIYYSLRFNNIRTYVQCPCHIKLETENGTCYGETDIVIEPTKSISSNSSGTLCSIKLSNNHINNLVVNHNGTKTLVASDSLNGTKVKFRRENYYGYGFSASKSSYLSDKKCRKKIYFVSQPNGITECYAEPFLTYELENERFRVVYPGSDNIIKPYEMPTDINLKTIYEFSYPNYEMYAWLHYSYDGDNEHDDHDIYNFQKHFSVPVGFIKDGKWQKILKLETNGVDGYNGSNIDLTPYLCQDSNGRLSIDNGQTALNFEALYDKTGWYDYPNTPHNLLNIYYWEQERYTYNNAWPDYNGSLHLNLEVYHNNKLIHGGGRHQHHARHKRIQFLRKFLGNNANVLTMAASARR